MTSDKLSEHFTRREFQCPCGCGMDDPRPELIQALEDLRERIAHFHGERPIVIASGCRCATHNAKVGGAKHSRHMYRDAADLIVPGLDPDQVMALAEQVGPVNGVPGAVDGFGGLGVGLTRIHVDTRPRNALGERARWTYSGKKYKWKEE